MTRRYNLSHTMHVVIMGERFMDLSRARIQSNSRTYDALQTRGLFDENHRRTPEAMAYIQERCNARDKRLADRYPGVTVIYNDVGLLAEYDNLDGDKNDVSVYVYAGSTPMLVLDGNGQHPVALLSTRYMWDIQVGIVWNSPNTSIHTGNCIAGRFLQRHSIGGHKGSYGYEFMKDRVAEELKSLVRIEDLGSIPI